MNKSITVQEAANQWGVTERTVINFCRSGKVPAEKNGKSWLIAADAVPPQSRKGKKAAPKRLRDRPLPVGISDYKLASDSYYYVDKTLLIRDFLDEKPQVILFTRPRRFGKTLNMDMLKTFFEKSEEDTARYFRNTELWACGEKYRSYQGKYPVVYLSFKDVRRDSWEETYAHMQRLLADEFRRHAELENSPACGEFDRQCYCRIASGQGTVTDTVTALGVLTNLLHRHHGQPAVIIIDEYDTPIQQGFACNYYDQVIAFMRNFFSAGLKDNRDLAFGFLTGILRVAKESIFSGLNNLVVNSVLDKQYSRYFGFTAGEVSRMASDFGKEEKLPEIEQWYDGYLFGGTEIYNPWSVINYFRSGCEAKAYWVSTSSNDIIKEVLSNANGEVFEQMSKLMRGDSILTPVDTGVVYASIRHNQAAIYSLLLVSGYLKASPQERVFGSLELCEVSIPNREIRSIYQSEIMEQLPERNRSGPG